MRWILDMAIAFVTLGVVEAWIKPLAARFVKDRTRRFAPAVLEWLDRQLPSLLTAYRGQELEQVVRTQLETLNKAPVSQSDVDELFRMLDVRVTADRLHERQSDGVQ